MNLVEMNSQEVKEVDGGWKIFGWTIFSLTGVLDGILNNTELTVVGFEII